MEDKKRVKIIVVILNCFCALIWDINLIVGLLSGYSDKLKFLMHVICAIAWSICGIGWSVRYIKQKKIYSENANNILFE